MVENCSDIQEYQDTDKTFSAFIQACVEAGEEKCALARPDTSAADTENKVWQLLETIKYNPIPIDGALITYDVVKSIILGLLYSPSQYPDLALGLNALITGNLTGAAGLASAAGPQTLVNESRQGIECGDKYSRVKSLADLRPVIAEAYNVSRLSGDNVPLLVMQCSRWKFNAKERYAGRFEVKTRTPVLLISNTFDPVAPVAAGRNLSAALEGSVLLQQHGFGVSSPSPCFPSLLFCPLFFSLFIIVICVSEKLRYNVPRLGKNLDGYTLR